MIIHVKLGCNVIVAVLSHTNLCFVTAICIFFFFLILNTNQRVDSGNQFSTHFKQRLLFVDPF